MKYYSKIKCETLVG